MRWFKHIARAREDEAMVELLSEFGPEGYGVWWIILEQIAEQMDGKSDRCCCRYPLKKWATNCGVSAKKFQKIAEKLAKLGKISIEKTENLYIIECRNLLKFRDEYTSKNKEKSGECRDKLRAV